MISRRKFLLASIAALFAGKVTANSAGHGKISWSEFQIFMIALAKESHNFDEKMLAKKGMSYLRQLDIDSPGFHNAVDASYESGNRYWLWQRMLKLRNINGGILNIDSEQPVQLHDHPGATGLLRIMCGETEVWKFDEVKQNKTATSQHLAELTLVSHRILRAGDTAVLTPNKGNIHALRAVSKECRMLDFFIPPYVMSQRSWYQPITEKWFDKKKIICKKISQNDFTVT